MYLIDVLVPFNLLVDTDMGLLKLLEYDYDNHDFFYPGILHTSEINQQYALLTRTDPNPITAVLQVEDKELADDLYSQFMEKEYDQILQLSCNTAVSNLAVVLKNNMDQVIRITVLCNSKKEEDVLIKRNIGVFKTVIGNFSTVDISEYGSIYIKNVTDLDKYKEVVNKNIYVANYGFNITIDPDNIMPLLPEETIRKYGSRNEFDVFSLYAFDARKLPLG